MRGVLSSLQFEPARKATGLRRNRTPPKAGWWVLLGVALTLSGCARPEAPRVLRVCAHPNNLPFSDRAERGFENRIAAVLADELDARLEYTWVPHRALVSAALIDGRCEVIIGLPAGSARALTTRPYYRSSTVFETRVERTLDVSAVVPSLPPVEDGEPDRFISFDVALGVRRGRPELRDRLQRALDHRNREITAILEQFGVPLLALPQQEARR